MDKTELLPQDNWHLVKDPKKRKQIQDRLAQRARSTSCFISGGTCPADIDSQEDDYQV